MSPGLLRCLLAFGALAQAGCSPSPARERAAAAPPGPAAAALATAPPAAPPPGPAARGEAFEIGLEPPAAARAGQSATARVVVRARGPYHVNRDYPMSFRPDPAATAAFEGERVPLDEGAERTPCADHPGEHCAVSAPLRFTPPAAGETRLAGTVAFSVCNPDRCLIEKVPLAATVAAR